MHNGDPISYCALKVIACHLFRSGDGYLVYVYNYCPHIHMQYTATTALRQFKSIRYYDYESILGGSHASIAISIVDSLVCV